MRLRSAPLAGLLAVLGALALSACSAASGGGAAITTNDPVALTRIYMDDLKAGNFVAAHKLNVNAPNNIYEGTGANPPPNTLERYYQKQAGTAYTVTESKKLVANWIYLVTVKVSGKDYVFVWDAHYGPYRLSAVDEALPYPTGNYATQA